jgi:hypothetical protein
MEITRLMPWSSPFDDPINSPKGKPLVTLQDAADYIMRLRRRIAPRLNSRPPLPA